MRTCLALAVVVVSASAAYADLQTGRDKLSAGDYKTAIAELKKVTGKDQQAARVLLAKAQIATGDYAGADTTLASMAQGKDAVSIEARIVLAELREATGRIADARKDMEALFKDKPELNVRTQLALVRTSQGDIAGARKLWDLTLEEEGQKKLDYNNPNAMHSVALAARATNNVQLSNEAYREALSRGPKETGIGVSWADLYLQKYHAALAEQTLEEVFKVNPNHPEAHAVMAEVILETRYDLQAVRHHLEKALGVNPKNARALRARASIEIDNNEWAGAVKTLDAILAINKEDTEALAMKATIFWLRDDIKSYNAEKAKAFAVNPAYAQLYRIVARSAVREHRYVEAVELEKEAVKLKPDFFEAMAGAGLGYLRLGMEQEGIDWINKSWVGDQYNVRAANTRELYRDILPKNYTMSTTKSFKIRYDNDEKPVFSRYLEPTMETAFADMAKRYGFTPKTPVTLELYADRKWYGVRTVGLPDISALGVCFGQVITAMSPMNGDINWGMVMWHELGHVFAIQLSNSRVPRWYTEGLSEYETLVARPEWRRENDADLYGAVLQGTLPSIAKLNEEFMQPDQNAVVVAYYQSAVTIEYLIQTYGFPKIVEGLKLYGKGKETPEVLRTITGKPIPQLDSEFRKYLDVRLAPYAGTFKLPTRGFDDVTKLEIAADASPRDAKAKSNVALGYYYGGDADKAFVAANAALAIDPKQAIARYILAEIAVHKGEVPKAKQLITSLVADGIDNSDLRGRLAQIAESENNFNEQEKQLCAAKKLDPERSFAYQELSELYAKRGDNAKSLAELEHYAFIEQMEVAPLKKLVTEYAKLANWPKVRTFGEMAMYITPHDPELLQQLARAYQETGDGNKAIFSYDTMLLLTPPPRRPALVHIGRTRAYMAMKKIPEAKAALAQAMKTEPENAEALQLKAQLK